MKIYKYSRKKMEKELVDWKENSGSSKRFNGILMRLLSTLPQEDKKECHRCQFTVPCSNCVICGKSSITTTNAPSPLDSLEEIEEINSSDFAREPNTNKNTWELMEKINSLIRNQTKIINYLKGKK